MRKSTCKHCGEAIGEWADPWGGHREWMHAPDDGPDAYRECHCHCFDCDPKNGYAHEHPCCAGEEAEPVPPTAAEQCGMTETQYRYAESLYLHGDLQGPRE